MINSILLASCLLSLNISTGIDLCRTGDYETGYSILSIVRPNPGHFNDYWFYRAVAAHQLLHKEDAELSTKNLLDSFNKLPRRYEAIAYEIQDDISKWKPGLNTISRKMGDVGRRLDAAKAGPETQRRQKEIVSELDKLIKAEEDKKNGMSGKADSAKESDDKSQNASSPADESKILENIGKGGVDKKDLAKYADSWGKLPMATRAKIIQDITSDYPPKYKEVIESYRKAINKLGEK